MWARVGKLTKDGVLPQAQSGVSRPQTERTSRETWPGCVTRVSRRHLKKQRPELYREMNPGGRGPSLPAPIPSQGFSMDEPTRTLGMKVLQLSLSAGRQRRVECKSGETMLSHLAWYFFFPKNFQNHTVAEELFTKVIHTRQTKTTYFHHAHRFTKKKKRVLFPITSPWPLWSLTFLFFPLPPSPPPTVSHCPWLVRHRKQHGGYNLWDHPLHVGTASGCGAELTGGIKKNGILKFLLSSKAAGDGRTRDVNFMPSITWAASFENAEFLKCWPWKW